MRKHTRSFGARRFLICGCKYGAGNIGDESILLGLTRILRRSCPDCDIRVCTANGDFTRRELGLDGYGLSREQTIRALRWATHVLLGGGTLIEDTDHIGYPLQHNAWLLETACALGRPVCFAAVGGGRLSPQGKALVARYFGISALHTARNEQTARLLTDAGIPGDHVRVTADAAYALLEEEGPAASREEQCLVGVNAVNETCADRYGPQYRELLATALNEFAERSKIPIEFFGSEVRAGDYFDWQANRNVASMLHPQVAHKITRGQLVHPLRFIQDLRRFRLIVSMRMHVVMFGAMLGLPVIPVLRSDKMRFCADELGLSRRLSAENLDPQALRDLMIEALRRPAPFVAPHDRVETLRDRAFQTGEHIRDWSATARPAGGGRRAKCLAAFLWKSPASLAVRKALARTPVLGQVARGCRDLLTGQRRANP